MTTVSGKSVRDGSPIRDASAADCARLTRIAREAKAHWEYPATWLAQWEATLTITPDFVHRHVVREAEVSGLPIGFHALVDGTGFWRLEHLWIQPAFHGRGVGRALFLDAVALIRGRRPGIMRIEAEPNAAGFYRRMGAIRVGAVPAPAPGAPDRTLPLFELRVEAE